MVPLLSSSRSLSHGAPPLPFPDLSREVLRDQIGSNREQSPEHRPTTIVHDEGFRIRTPPSPPPPPPPPATPLKSLPPPPAENADGGDEPDLRMKTNSANEQWRSEIGRRIEEIRSSHSSIGDLHFMNRHFGDYEAEIGDRSLAGFLCRSEPRVEFPLSSQSNFHCLRNRPPLSFSPLCVRPNQFFAPSFAPFLAFHQDERLRNEDSEFTDCRR